MDLPSILAQGRNGRLYGTTENGGASDDGVVFRQSATGSFTVIYEFDGAHGCHPGSGLTLGLDGNFYGTTGGCGLHGLGTIFQITPAGIVTTVHDFNGFDGQNTFSPPIQGRDGSFYGMSGLQEYRFLFDPNSKSWLYQSWAAERQSAAPLLLGRDGNFYGTTMFGGTHNDGRLFSITPLHAFRGLHVFDGIHGAQPWGGLALGLDGNFYGTAAKGEASDCGVAFRITPSGIFSPLHIFEMGSGCSPYAGLVAATDGNFYGAAAFDPVHTGTLYRLTQSGEYTVLHSLDRKEGSFLRATMMQHTNGNLYGLTLGGGAHDGGVLYSLNVGAKPFVYLVNPFGLAGQVVQILGQGFKAATRVSFGSIPTSFTVVSDTYLTAIAPSGGRSGPVRVTTPSGTLISSRAFQYVPAILTFAPRSGAAGTKVVITGYNLLKTIHVAFGNKMAPFTVNSNSQVTAEVPSGATSGKISVTTPDGTSTTATGFKVKP